MNYIIIVVGITIISILPIPFFLQTQTVYEKVAYEQGYDVEEIKDSHQATEEEEKAMEDAEENDDTDDD